MTDLNPNGTPNGSELRQRLPNDPAIPRQAESLENARETVMSMNTAEEKADKNEKDKKTYGRTPDGTGMFQSHLAHVCHESKT